VRISCLFCSTTLPTFSPLSTYLHTTLPHAFPLYPATSSPVLTPQVRSLPLIVGCRTTTGCRSVLLGRLWCSDVFMVLYDPGMLLGRFCSLWVPPSRAMCALKCVYCPGCDHIETMKHDYMGVKGYTSSDGSLPLPKVGGEKPQSRLFPDRSKLTDEVMGGR